MENDAAQTDKCLKTVVSIPVTESRPKKCEGCSLVRSHSNISAQSMTWPQILFTVMSVTIITSAVIDSCLPHSATLDALEAIVHSLEEKEVVIVFITYTSIYVGLTALGFPGTLPAIGAGYIFSHKYGTTGGIILGSFSSYVGSVCGGLIVMMITRHMLRSWAIKLFQKQGRLSTLDRALSQAGYKLNFLLRLQPVIPTNVLNFMLGVTNTTYIEYSFGYFGLLPWIVFCAYVGSGVNNMTDVSKHEAMNRKMYIFAFAGSAVLLLAAIILISRHAQAVIEQALSQARKCGDLEKRGSKGEMAPLVVVSA